MRWMDSTSFPKVVIPMSDNEKLVFKRLYKALKPVVGKRCSSVCSLCEVYEVCEKSCELFYELEQQLRECGEIK